MLARRRVQGLVALLFLAAPCGAAPLELRGTVLGLAGDGLPAARVELRPLPTNFEAGRRLLAGLSTAEPAAATATDATGRFRLQAPGAGVWRVEIRSPGFVPLRYEPLVAVEDRELPPAILRRDVGAQVRVVSPVGDPVPAARVVAVSEADLPGGGGEDGWRPAPRSGWSDENGDLVLPRADGERLVLDLPGVAVSGPARAVTAGDPITLRVAASTSVEIEVRAPAGEPLAGVLVRGGSRARPLGVTGRDGRASLALADRGDVELRLVAADGRGERVVLPGSPGGDDDLRVVVLPPPRLLAGRVLDVASRRPLAGAVVWTGVDPGTWARTDAEGRYHLAVPEGRFWVQAEAAGYLPQAAGVEAAHPRRGRLPTLALGTAAEVRGRVVDGQGAPLAGALVEAYPARSDRRPFFRPDGADGRGRSDGRGRFAAGGLVPSIDYRLRVSRPGYAAVTLPFVAPGPPSVAPSLEVVLAAARPVFGRVVDLEGRAVAAARVVLGYDGRGTGRMPPVPRTVAPSSIECDQASQVSCTQTDADGYFEVAAIPVAEVALAVDRDGYAPVRVQGVQIPPGEGPADLGTLVLAPGATLAGRVLDPEGEPVAGAAVYLVRGAEAPDGEAQARLRHGRPAAVSDPAGAFLIRDLIPGQPLGLYVHADGRAPAWLPGVEAPAEAPLRVILRPALAVSGRVVDQAGGPLPNARVTLVWQEVLAGATRRVAVGPGVEREAITDRRGRFEIGGLLPGDATVEVYRKGFVPAPPREIRLIPGEGIAGVDFVLERGAAVEGRVTTRSGEPVAGARITAGRPSAVTDGDGAYRLEGVPLGPAALEAFHSARGRRVKRIDVEPGVNPLDWTLEDGVRVSGRVMDETGEPLAGATVRVDRRTAAGQRGVEVRSTADGSFELYPVTPGRYRLRVGKPGYAETVETLRVGQETVEDLEIFLLPGGILTGRIEGLDFHEMERVQVQAFDAAGRSWRGQVDYQGRYEVADLAPGHWQVEASLDGGHRQARGRVTLPDGNRRVELDLRFGGGLTLTGRVLFDGRPLDGTTVTLTGNQRSAQRTVATSYLGEFRFEDLEPGAYHLGLKNPRELLTHDRTLSLESDQEVVIDLTASRVAGRVVAAATGAGVSSALVSLRRLAREPGQEESLLATGTGIDGRFELSRVPPGLYRLSARRDGYSPVEEEVEVRAGVDLPALHLELAATEGLELVVRLASGQIPTLVHVQLLDASGRVVLTESRPLDGSGGGHLPTVPTGTWELLVGASGGAHRRFAVTVPGEKLEAILPLAGRLHVRVPELATSDLLATLQVMGSDNRPLQIMDMGGTLTHYWPLHAGSATLDGVPAGAWVVQVTATDGRVWSGPVATAAGMPSELVLD